MTTLGSTSTTSTTTSTDGLPPDQIIGTPYQDITEWDGQQTATDDCAIRAQQFIIEQFTGQKLSEQALEQEAQANGWYDPGHGGTPIADMGKLLQSHGIAVDTFSHATVTQLADELAQGHKVIIAVNAEDLWKHDPALQGAVQTSGGQGADHAVVVSGIDTTDPDHPKVLISDPGTGEAIASYPLDEFLQSWKASDFAMVATHDPAPSTLPEMTNFDYTTGHIPVVMGMPYDEFATAQAWWDAMVMGGEMPVDPYSAWTHNDQFALPAANWTTTAPLDPFEAANPFEAAPYPSDPGPYAPWEHVLF